MIYLVLLERKVIKLSLFVLFLAATFNSSSAASAAPLAGGRYNLPISVERAIDPEDIIEISSRVFDSTMRLTASKDFGGAFVSLIFRDKQYLVNDRAGVIAYGRSLQSAAAFDDRGECYNPTEAGGHYDLGKRESSSKLIASKTEKNSMSTEANMAFFAAPGAKPPGGRCGEKKDLTSAQNTSILSGYYLKKKVTLGYMDLPNVIDYYVTFVVPKAHDKARFEAISMHLTPEFSEANVLTYNEGRLVPTRPQGNMQHQPIILTTKDHERAVGIYSPMLPLSGRDYGHRAAKDLHVLRSIFWEENIKPGEYSYRCFLVIGNKSEVVNTMKLLIAKLHYNDKFKQDKKMNTNNVLKLKK